MARTASSSLRFTRRILTGRIILPTAAAFAFVLPQFSWAVNVIKADNSTALNTAGSWIGGVAPGVNDLAVWDSTVTGANTVLLGGNLALGGLRVTNPNGTVTISAGNTLTLGAGGVDLGSSLSNLTIEATVATAANAAQTWSVAAGRSLTLSAQLSRGVGSGINFSGAGATTLNGNTSSSLIPYGTFGGTDIAALNSSKVISGATGVFTFVNPAGGNASGTAVGIDVQTTTVGATQGYRHSNTLTVTNGVRFNANNTQNTKWTVDTSSAGRLGTLPVILVTSNVTQNIEYNGSGGIRALSSGGELILNHRGSGDLIFNVGIFGNGASSLTKLGAGKVIIAAASAYTGATNITEGVLQIGNGGALGSIGSTSLVNSSELAFNRNDAVVFTAAISGSGAVTQAGTGTLSLTGSNTYTGATNFNAGVVRFTSLSNFGSGTTLNFGGGTLQWNVVTTDISTRTVNIGAGGANLDTNGNAVTLANGVGNSGTGGLTKVGAGTLALAGANTYSGATNVDAGILRVTGTLVGAANVSSNATLGGTGTIGGLVTVNAGGVLAPGASVGSITVGSLTLAANAIVNVEFNTSPANDFINVTTSGGLTINGGGFNLYQENTTSAFATAGTYNLIGYTGAIGGAGVGALSVLNPQPATNYAITATGSNVQVAITSAGFSSSWNVATGGSWATAGNWSAGVPDASGAAANLTTAITGPATITLDGAKTVGSLALDSNQSYTVAAGAGGTLTFDSGLSQSNLIATNGAHTISVPVVLSSNTVAAIAGPASLSVSGEVGGAGTLTKSGGGSLNLTNLTNSMSGTVTVSEGTLGIAAAGSLGTGSLVINGGTISFNSGNVDDISSGRSIALGINGGTVNTNGNDVTLASSIGNAGAGGLTKSGMGKLILSAANTYTGTTTISGGALSISTNSALGNATTGSGVVLNGGTLQTSATIALNNAGANSRAFTLGVGGGAISTDPGTTLTISGVVTGSSVFTKTGAGRLTLTGNNAATFTSPIALSDGSIEIGGGQSNGMLGLGTGTVTFGGNTTLRLSGVGAADNGNSYGTLTNALVIPSGQTATIMLPKRLTISSALTGAGTLNLQVDGSRDELQGNWSAFTGTINVTGAGELRLSNFQNNVFNNSKLNLGAGVFLHQVFNPSSSSPFETVQAIGELSGAATSSIGGNPVGGRFVNWTIGSLNTSSVFSGTIVDDAGAARITKVGSGSLTLTNSSSYSGSTTISSGTLAVTNDNALGSSATASAGTIIAGNTSTAALGLSNNITVAEPLTLAGKQGGALTSPHIINTADANTLSGPIDLAAGGLDYNIESAAGTLTISGNLTPTTAALGARALNLQGAGTGVWSGNITDGTAVVSLTKRGTGAWTLSGAANSYTGSTTVHGGGTLKSGVANALPASTTLTLGEATANTAGTFDLNGFNQSVTGLTTAGTGANVITNGAASGQSALTVTGGGTFAGSINDGATATTALTKSTAGTLALTGTNNFTGPTTVTGGTLEISGSIGTTASVDISGGTLLLSGAGLDRVADGAAVTLSGGTLAYASSVTGGSETLGNLILSANSFIDFGSGAGNTLLFAGLNLGTNTLSVYNWSDALTTQDRLLFDNTTLPANLLAQINFYSDTGGTFLGTGNEISFGSDFEIVPVPEPSSTALLGSAGLLALVGMRERRRLGQLASAMRSR